MKAHNCVGRSPKSGSDWLQVLTKRKDKDTNVMYAVCTPAAFKHAYKKVFFNCGQRTKNSN